MDKSCSNEKNHEGLVKSNNGAESCNYEIPPYSESEADAVAKKLANKETFTEAWETVLAWLKKGYFDENSCDKFSALIQLGFDHEQSLKVEQLEKLTGIKEELPDQYFAEHHDEHKLENAVEEAEKSDIFNSFSKIHKEKIQAMRRDMADIKRIFLTGDIGDLIIKDE